MKKFATLAATAALLLGLGACASPAVQPRPVATPSLPACATEDYDGPVACYWDSAVRGNGTGQSFIWDGSKVIKSHS